MAPINRERLRAWAASPTPLPQRVRNFIETEVSSAVLLFTATAVALLWSNVLFAKTYDQIWTLLLRVDFNGIVVIDMDIRHWINEGAMTIFFFLIALEIKRELSHGNLRERRVALLPMVAAFGGAVVPALIYIAINHGHPGSRGWGIPMATGTAFALGVLVLLGDRVPAGLRAFVLALAIVDDVIAIVIIAVFFSHGLKVFPTILAILTVSLVILGRMAGVRWRVWYLLLGVVLWIALYENHVHATLAAVIMGFLTPTKVRNGETIPESEVLETRLHPWSSYFVVPLFALANAGIAVRHDALASHATRDVFFGIVIGLVVGKLVGVTFASWFGVAVLRAKLPGDVRPHHVVGGGLVAGIGFTVSLFMAGLAFPDGSSLLAAAKLAILTASFLSAALGSGWLIVSARRTVSPQDP